MPPDNQGQGDKGDKPTTPCKIRCQWSRLPIEIHDMILEHLGLQIIENYKELLDKYVSDHGEDGDEFICNLIDTPRTTRSHPLKSYFNAILVCKRWHKYFTNHRIGSMLPVSVSEMLQELQAKSAQEFAHNVDDIGSQYPDVPFLSLSVTLGPFWNNSILLREDYPFATLMCRHDVFRRNDLLRLLSHLEPWILRLDWVPTTDWGDEMVVGIPIQWLSREKIFLKVCRKNTVFLDLEIYLVIGFAIPYLMSAERADSLGQVDYPISDIKEVEDLDLIRGLMESTAENSEKKPFWLFVAFNENYDAQGTSRWYLARFNEDGPEVYATPDEWGDMIDQMGYDRSDEE